MSHHNAVTDGALHWQSNSDTVSGSPDAVTSRALKAGSAGGMTLASRLVGTFATIVPEC